MYDLDEKKYFLNILKSNKHIDNYNKNRQSTTYNRIIDIIKNLMSGVVNDIKLFPSLNIFQELLHFSDTHGAMYIEKGHIYTNYNLYLEIKWLFTKTQHYIITEKDFEIKLCFYDTKKEYIINFEMDNWTLNITNMKNNNEIKSSEKIKKELHEKFNIIKMIHPKLLFTYASVMEINESEEFYKILNEKYNLVENIKNTNEENVKLMKEKYESELKLINNENKINKEKKEKYLEELTNSQIMIEKNLMEIEKLKKMNEILIKKYNDLTN
jgi:hypothetical protein